MAGLYYGFCLTFWETATCRPKWPHHSASPWLLVRERPSRPTMGVPGNKEGAFLHLLNFTRERRAAYSPADAESPPPRPPSLGAFSVTGVRRRVRGGQPLWLTVNFPDDQQYGTWPSFNFLEISCTVFLSLRGTRSSSISSFNIFNMGG